MWSLSSNRVLLSVLALVTCPASEARTVSHVAKASILRAHVASRGLQLKRADPKEEKPQKEMEDPISIMRGELCWSREKLIGHVDCMEWLVEECTTHSFGTGLCNRVMGHVKEECQEETDSDYKKQACHYAERLGIEIDSDDDGVLDEDDAFPKDPKESNDTDGDGVGDNGDDYPNDPLCQKKPCPLPAPAPAPPPATAPAPAPAAKEDAPAPAEAAVEEKEAPAPTTPEPKKEEPATTPVPKEPPAKESPAKEPTEAAPEAAAEASGTYESPDAKEGLQSQGFSGKKVIHVDGETVVSDWGKEYGHHAGSKPKRSSSTRLWQPHALTLVAGVLTLACAA